MGCMYGCSEGAQWDGHAWVESFGNDRRVCVCGNLHGHAFLCTRHAPLCRNGKGCRLHKYSGGIIWYMAYQITQIGELCDVWFCSKVKSRCDPCSSPQDVAEEAKYSRQLREAILKRVREDMPQIVFSHRFWSDLMDFAGSDVVIAHCQRIATAHAVSAEQVRGEFFEAVVDSCRGIQTSRPPQPQRRRVFGWPWIPQRAQVAEPMAMGIVVRNQVVARIMYHFSATRIIVDRVVV
jgi:hypothetical protein